MAETGNTAGGGGRDRRPGRRPKLDGVVVVSVGRARDRAPVEGAQQAHVARIHDLPSLIHAVVSGTS